MPSAPVLDFSGRVVIVTGGTRGIGRAIAEAFLGAGATVAICGRTAPASLPEAGGRVAEFHAADIRKATEAHAFVAAVAARHGRLDVVVNNAGGSPQADAATASPRFSEAIVALNLLAPLHVSQAAHAVMVAQPEGGVILNIASVSAERPSPGTAIYGAAKAGLVSLTRSLAQEWGPAIRVNAIIVGLIQTDDAELTYGSATAQSEIAASLPLGRMGRGTDVAAAALFLASPLAAYISGARIEVHGGDERPHFLSVVAAHAEPAATA